jgi:ASCH domain
VATSGKPRNVLNKSKWLWPNSSVGLPSRDPASVRVGVHGLLIREPYVTQLLNGEKTWEIRGRSTQIRGTIAIIRSGSGKVFGTVNLVRVLGPLALSDLVEARELTVREREEFRRNGLPYSKTFAYVCSHPRWFREPVRYDHPNGAVTWVRLPDLDLSRAEYAPAIHAGARRDLA